MTRLASRGYDLCISSYVAIPIQSSQQMTSPTVTANIAQSGTEAEKSAAARSVAGSDKSVIVFRIPEISIPLLPRRYCEYTAYPSGKHC